MHTNEILFPGNEQHKVHFKEQNDMLTVNGEALKTGGIKNIMSTVCGVIVRVI